VLGNETEQEQTMQTLRRAKGLIKRDLGDWLRIRTVPELTFKQDQSIERGFRILQLMKGLEREAPG
jgi:ribosome-binding factor A